MKTSSAEKFSYALGDVAVNIAWRGVAAFLFVFQTEVAGLSPAAAGAVSLAAWIAGGAADVAFGALADRTRSRLGRYRPWILWTALPLAVSLSLLFTCPQSLGAAGRLAYAAASALVFTVVYSAATVPYGALMSAMSSDPAERASIGGWRMAGAFAGGLAVQSLMFPARDFFGSYSAAMYAMSAALAILFPFACFGTRERVPPPAERGGGFRADAAALVLRNPPWRALFAVLVLLNVCNAVRQGSAVLWFSRYAGCETLAGTYMAALSLAAVAGAVATPRLVRRFGSRRAMTASLAAYGAFCMAAWLCPPGRAMSLFAPGAAAEFFAAVASTLGFAMLGDVADWQARHGGRHAAGLVYSTASLAIKAGAGLGGAAIGLAMAHSSSAFPSEAARSLASTIPGVFAFLAALASRRFRP